MTKRRQFVAGAMTAPLFVPRHVLGGRGHVAPSDKVNVALVGAGGQGRSNLHALFGLADVQVIAVADPAELWDMSNFYYKGVAGRKPVAAEIEKHYSAKTPNAKCAQYADFRVLLEKEKAVDAVLCATPDHQHAFVSSHAMRAGKHIYCEKPLTHNIAEARHLAKLAKECKVATQMGNQGHSTKGIRETVEWVTSGALGTVRHVHAWVSSSRWNKTLAGAPTGTTPLPAGLNWNMWLGPRAFRPFHSAYAPVSWRDFWAYGCGTLGDFGCHDMDAACWALDLQAPTSIEGYPAGYTDADIGPHGEICHYEFAAKGERPALKLTWYGGGVRPASPAGWPAGKQLPGRGVLFEGEKGVLYCGGAGGPPKLISTPQSGDVAAPPQSLPRSKGHHRDWIDACKGGPAAGSHFGYGAHLTEIVLLGVLSLRAGAKIHWDADKARATGLAKADEFIDEPRRTGWELA